MKSLKTIPPPVLIKTSSINFQATPGVVMSEKQELLALEELEVAPPTYEAAAKQHGDLPAANGTSAGITPVTHGPFLLDIPVLNQLRGKRVILASASPRRKQIISAVHRPFLTY